LLAEQCFNFEEFGPSRLDVLAGVVRSCRCFRVDTTSLPEACATITSLLEREGAHA
jgi:hypothetical protein